MAWSDRAVSQILSRAKAASGPGEDQHPRVAQIAQSVRHLLVHLDGEAVQPVGAVEGQAGDSVRVGEEDRVVSHLPAVAPPLPGGEGVG